MRSRTAQPVPAPASGRGRISDRQRDGFLRRCERPVTEDHVVRKLTRGQQIHR